MTENYKFQSSITKSILPMGVISINQIHRSEVSAYLEKIKRSTAKRFSDWGEMYFFNCIGKYDAWGEASILMYMQELKADIDKLTELLYVKEEARKHTPLAGYSITRGFDCKENFNTREAN